MPKKPTSFTPSKGKSSPLNKAAAPLTTPSIKATALPVGNKIPQPLDGGANKVAAMPGARFPKLTKPAKLAPRKPTI